MTIKAGKMLELAARDGQLSKVELANATIAMLDKRGSSGVKREEKTPFMNSARQICQDSSVRMSPAVRNGLKVITEALGSYDRSRKLYAPELDAKEVLTILDLRSAKGLSEKATKLIDAAESRRSQLTSEASDIREEIETLEAEREEVEFDHSMTSAQSDDTSHRFWLGERLEDVEGRLEHLYDRLAIVEEELG
jgi:hypothetical protein